MLAVEGGVATEVGGFATRRVCCQPDWLAAPLCAVVVSDDPGLGELLSVSHPEHPLQRVCAELEDPHGATAVWPCAYLAAERIFALRSSGSLAEGFSMAEVGCGAGLPSLAALELGAGSVSALDREALPLAFLEAAVPLRHVAKLRTTVADLCREDCSALLRSADVVVAADLLYEERVATRLAELLVPCVPQTELIIVDPRRRGREAFLAEFNRTLRLRGLGKRAFFEDAELPAWAPSFLDPFDGSSQKLSVGLLRLEPL